MSLDLTLYDANDEELLELNWLRNPFRLERWAEDNTGLQKELGHILPSLWDVCNQWSYDKGKDVDRALFRAVVLAYWERIRKLDRGYFAFDLPAYRQFVEGKTHLLPGRLLFENLYLIDGSEYRDGRLFIPMEHFSASAFNLSHPSLDGYKDWFRRLVDFAEALQDEKTRFCCSN